MTAATFFEELHRLLKQQPKPPSNIFHSENCTYGNYITRSKNLLYSFDASQSSDSMYLFDSHMCVNSMDCDYCVECESCYECVDTFRCYNCEFVQKADNTRDSSFSYDLSNCDHVFGCVNLKNKSYCVFNRQLSEAAYHEAVKKYVAMGAERVLEMLEDLKKQYPRTQSAGERNENSPYGNYIYENKNCYMCFDAARNEESGYLYDSYDNSFCYDLSYSANHNEFCYQLVNCEKMNNCTFTADSSNCEESSYLFNCRGVKNCFGCVDLQYKQYCILNRQLTQEAYERTLSELVATLNLSAQDWNGLIA